MEEAAPRHLKVIHYSALAGIRVGGKAANADTNPKFWPMVLEIFSKRRLKKGEADRAEKQVRDVIGCSDLVDESTGFVEAACQNYEVLVDDKRAEKTGGPGPSWRYDTQSGPRRNDVVPSGSQEKEKAKVSSF